MTSVSSAPDITAATTTVKDVAAVGGAVDRTTVARGETDMVKTNGHQLSVSSPEKAGMSDELKE